MSKRKIDDNDEDIKEVKKNANNLQTVSQVSQAFGSSQDRYQFNFWNRNERPNNNSTDKGELKIESLSLGKFEKRPVNFRITYKSEVKETTIGKILTILGMDDTGEVAIVIVGKESERYYNEFKVNALYSVENFNVVQEKIKYPSGSGNSLQIKLYDGNGIIKKINVENVPQINFSFQPLNTVKTLPLNSQVDVVAIFIRDYGLEAIPTGMSFRDLSITDESKEMMLVTLWGVAAEKFNANCNSTIVLRKAIIGEFKQQRNLICYSGTLVLFNSEISRAVQLSTWFNKSIKEIESNNY